MNMVNSSKLIFHFNIEINIGKSILLLGANPPTTNVFT